MTISFAHETDFSFGFDAEKAAENVIERTLDDALCPYETQVSVTFADAVEVRRINQAYRGMDVTTDVLSFPMLSYDAPGDFSFLGDPEEEDMGPGFADFFDPESGELLLGDIVLNMQRVKSQAEEYGHSILREFSFLVAHSMLHLLGYDHETPEDAAQMEKMQEQILSELGITRE